MKIVVLDKATLGDNISFDRFESFGEIELYDRSDENDLYDRIKDCDVIITNKIKLNRNTLNGADNLKLICETATGYDNIDLDYCREEGISVYNVKGYSTDNVAQLTVAMALSLVTRLKTFNGYVESGEYTRSGIANHLSPVYHEIKGMTWGIIGLGNIGKAVAKVAQALGCKVVAYKRTPDPYYDCIELDKLMAVSDIISIHLPLNDQTRGLINNERIALMKKDCILINVARGAIVDEGALAQAVMNNRIGGIGIDVYSVEPLSVENPLYELLNHENVCFTPHMAWGSQEARDRCIDLTYDNICNYLNGNDKNRVV